MLISIRAAAWYELPSECFTLVMVEPAEHAPDHRVRQAVLKTSPAPRSVTGTDFQGNRQRRLVTPAGEFFYDYVATIEAEPNAPVPEHAEALVPQDLPPETLIYLMPSRYIQSDRFTQWARSEFGSIAPGGRRVRAIGDWVHTHIKYQHGASDTTTTVMDTAVSRLGVCRDFAHMVIALCRALNLPARYVSGYALGLEPFDFHAYAQVYLEDRWYNVDATYDGLREALIPIALGRDAIDLDTVTFFGPNTFKKQEIEIHKVGD